MAPAPLSNSTRSLRKVTHVPLKVSGDSGCSGRALLEAGYVRQLGLQPEEKAKKGDTEKRDEDSNVPSLESVWRILKQFEGTPLPSTLPPASAFADIHPSQLIEFGNALTKVRQARLAELSQRKPGDSEDDRKPNSQSGGGASPADELESVADLVSSSAAAINAFKANSTSPIGMLNLERIEMTPAGLERGELVAAIPLAPKEKTSVVKQEWSVVGDELATIVTDLLCSISRTGVAENSDLAQATSSQNAHSNRLHGRREHRAAGPESASAGDSRKHAASMTHAASLRVTQAHKMTISTAAVPVAARDDVPLATSSCALENPSETDPMRVDYIKMMRKWRVRLYRYGLRLTYDLTVAEPGAAMRADYSEVEELRRDVQKAFAFRENYLSHGVPTPPGPLPLWSALSASGAVGKKHGADGSGSNIFTTVTHIVVPDGYAIDHVDLTTQLSYEDHDRRFDVLGCADDTWSRTAHVSNVFPTLRGLNGQQLLHGRTGSVNITHVSGGFQDGSFQFDITLKRTDEYFRGWRASVWNSLQEAAKAKYHAERTSKQAQLTAIEARVNGVDMLTLRREENDEIMECVLRWFLGVDFELMPGDRGNLSKNGSGSGLAAHEAKVSFINQAVDWENVASFFTATSGTSRRTGRSSGYEEAFTWFAEHGDMSAPPSSPSGYPGMAIARQIRAYDSTNYPGIPLAGPGKQEVSAATTSQALVEPGSGPVSIKVADASGFVAGGIAVIDSWERGVNGENPTGIQESQTIVKADKYTSTVTVQELTHAHDGQKLPFSILQTSPKGLLIAEWFEYTPSQGTMISIDSDVKTIA
ncbi:hypothetical protein B0T26DRAFT_749401 [Lasiosphaeria miniovina]|uniref:Uncharacterized protein n=1 Tax=Lasiosphaeria miniovina TaxID=1954250 RepID=A0AA40ATW9_9PEZI|nr:uncharacterized protein B0T26DRAFT_749401 [Lasiosphaeria miniovina]KAK0721933.1 hypothetical protein B0T26DRAFT_749401 [Lasiosphaeria miniovina]